MKSELLWLLLGMAAVTYLPRMLPLVLLQKVTFPGFFRRWLRFIPVAVLSALLAPSLLIKEGSISLGVENIAFWAAIPTFVVAFFTRSMLVTVAAGIVIFVGMQKVIF